MEHAENCGCLQHSSETQQSLSELEFERGIWNAAIYNEVDRIKYFISNGKTNERDNFGYTALHYAARNGNKEICELLIKDGRANLNAITKGGATPLHRASMMGHLKIVQLLIEFNAILNIQDEDGQTSLHRAAQRGHFGVCKLLLEHCSELKIIKDRKGYTAYDLLTTENDELKILLKP